MKCPRTGVPLQEIEIEGIKIDVSPACGGVWFDNYEFSKFDEEHESAGDRLIEYLGELRTEGLNLNARINCPRDPDMVMMRYYFSSQRQVEIDECPQCGGIWLDAGELTRIRDMFPTEEARAEAGRAFINEVFEHSGLDKGAKETEAFKKKSRRMANLLRFICPSSYIPKKQDWGAF